MINYQLMKRKFISLVCCLFAALNCSAELEHRISYTFGFVSHAYHQERHDEHTYKFHDQYYFPGPNDHGRYEYTDEQLLSLPLVFNLQYDCSLREHIGVGLCIGYERERMYQETNIIKSNGEQTSPFGNTYTLWENEHKTGELRRRILYFLPEVTAYWFKKRHVAMYSKAAIGFRINMERVQYNGSYRFEKQTNPNNVNPYFQFTPVAIEVGGPYWRGNIEFGYGAQGIFQYGVKHIFKGKTIK